MDGEGEGHSTHLLVFTSALPSRLLLQDSSKGRRHPLLTQPSTCLQCWLTKVKALCPSLNNPKHDFKTHQCEALFPGFIENSRGNAIRY